MATWRSSPQMVNSDRNMTILTEQPIFQYSPQESRADLTPFFDSFLYRLHTKTLPDRKPKDVFKLISRTFTKNCEWPIKEFREVLNRIIDADPSIKNKKSYRSIDDYLIGCGFY